MSDQTVVEIICKGLDEQPGRAGEAIAYHVQAYGPTAVGELAVEARRLHRGSGLARKDGGRRSLGGVYFQLAKDRGWLCNLHKIRQINKAAAG